MAECKSCKAEIIWIKTPAGRNHPVDAEPMSMWVQNEDHPVNQQGWSIVQGHISHFATCPNADQHRGTGSE